MPKINVLVTIPTDFDVKDANDEQVRAAIASLFPFDPRFEQLKKAGCSVSITVTGPNTATSETVSPPKEAQPAPTVETPAKEAPAQPATATQPENPTP